MASGEVVANVLRPQPPATSSATWDTRAGGSTPNEVVEVWDFDASSQEYMDYRGRLKGYGGGGLTVRLAWSASSATSGNNEWEAAFRAFPDDTEALGSSHSYSYQAVIGAAPSASGEVSYDSIPFTNSQIDSLADGEEFILRIRRDTTTASNMSGDAELWSVLVYET